MSKYTKEDNKYFRYMNKILKSIFKIIISYLSMLSIRSKKIYIFGSWFGEKFADNPKYLYLEALEDKTLRPIWITKNKGVCEELIKKGYEVYLYKSLKGIYYQLRASVFFTCTNREDVYAPALGGAVHIDLWHGLPLKKIMYDDKISNLIYNSKHQVLKSQLRFMLFSIPYKKEYVVSTSKKITEIYTSAFRKNKDKILELGQPRNDIFFDNSLEVDEFPQIYKDKKIILYMPTHRNEGKIKFPIEEVLDLELLNKFCEENNIIFLIKKHYYHQKEKIELKNYTNIKDITQLDFDAQQLLKHADILITDYSSCYIDYLLLNRPIIFYNFDYDKYTREDRELYFEYSSVTPGVKAENFQDLYEALSETVQEGYNKFREEREKVTSIFYSPKNQKIVGENILKHVRELI